jgi:hypothetical protein
MVCGEIGLLTHAAIKQDPPNVLEREIALSNPKKVPLTESRVDPFSLNPRTSSTPSVLRM